MIENYEQKMLIEYLLEGLNKINKKISYEDNYHKINRLIDEINSANENEKISFNLNIDMIKINYTHDKRTPYRQTLKEIIKILTKKYNKLKKSSLSQREKTFRIFKKIFNLSEEEINIFALLSRNEISETFCDCLCLATDIRGRCNIHKMIKIYLKDSATTYESLEHLKEYGLVERQGHRGMDFGVPRYIEELLNNQNSNEKIVVEKILGKNTKSNLKKQDFSHIKEEFNIVSSILKNSLLEKMNGINILLYGEVGTGKTEFAKTLCKSIKTTLHEVICEDENSDETNRNERLSDLKRKIKLCSNINKNKIILFDEAEDLFRDTFFHRSTESKAFINNLLENNAIPVIWTTNDIYNMDKAYLRRFTYAIKFEKLSDEIQLQFLKKEFVKNDFEIEDEELERLSKKYNLSSSTVTNSIKLIKLTNSKNDKFEEFVKKQIKLLNRGKEVKEKTNNIISENYNFELINTNIDMLDLINKIKKTNKHNFSLCLYGEAGTGKSEYAKQLANKLGFEVTFRRASDLMSKWVGETEQNIANAFKEAKDKKTILIFDEADSLLQSRGNAQRNWEISQVNEMLTWMESHPYPFICTTNFMDSLDEASLRRFTFKIKFNYMETEQVQKGFKHFFNQELSEDMANIKGLTAGDFATVKKKNDFLGITDKKELINMLLEEVKIKKSKELSNSIGF